MRTNLSKDGNKWTVECDYHDDEDPVTHEFTSREAAEAFQRNPRKLNTPKAEPKQGKRKDAADRVVSIARKIAKGDA